MWTGGITRPPTAHPIDPDGAPGRFKNRVRRCPYAKATNGDVDAQAVHLGPVQEQVSRSHRMDIMTYRFRAARIAPSGPEW